MEMGYAMPILPFPGAMGPRGRCNFLVSSAIFNHGVPGRKLSSLILKMTCCGSCGVAFAAGAFISHKEYGRDLLVHVYFWPQGWPITS